MTIPSAGEPRQPKQLLQNDPFSQPGYTDNFYDAVGGHETFVKLIDVFYDGVATDPLLRAMYPEEDLGPAKRRFAGPRSSSGYIGRSSGSVATPS